MRIQAQDLKDEYKKAFTEAFYEAWDVAEVGGYTDDESSIPWGCPWLHGGNAYLTGETVDEMAKDYYHRMKDFIKAEFINEKK